MSRFTECKDQWLRNSKIRESNASSFSEEELYVQQTRNIT